jgi:hypothetical protein
VEACQASNVIQWRYYSKALLLGDDTELEGNGRGLAVRVVVGRGELSGGIEYRKCIIATTLWCDGDDDTRLDSQVYPDVVWSWGSV